MKDKQFAAKILHFIELFGIITTLALLPVDRFPFLHTVPLKLGMLSFICLVIASTVRLYQLWKKKHESLKRLLLVGMALLLPFVVYAISITYAISPSHAKGAALLSGLGIARAFAFCLLLSANFSLRRISERTLYIVTAVVVGFGLFQFFFDVFGAPTFVTDLKYCCTSNSTYVFPRVHSTALEPLYFDHFLMIPIWLLTFRFMRSEKSRKDRRFIVLFLATTTLFILTVARSATIGLLFASVFFLFVIRKRAGFKSFFRFIFKQWAMAIILALILIGISGVASLFIDKTAQYGSHSGFGSIGLFGSHAVDFNDGSSQTRYELWPRAWDYFKEKPLVGVGADNARIRLNLADYNSGTPLKKLQPFNNDALGYIVDFGLFGIVMLLPLLVLTYVAIRKGMKGKLTHWASPFIFALIGMAVQGNFFQSILLTRTWVVIGLVLFLFVDTPNKSLPKKVQPK